MYEVFFSSKSFVTFLYKFARLFFYVLMSYDRPFLPEYSVRWFEESFFQGSHVKGGTCLGPMKVWGFFSNNFLHRWFGVRLLLSHVIRPTCLKSDRVWHISLRIHMFHIFQRIRGGLKFVFQIVCLIIWREFWMEFFYFLMSYVRHVGGLSKS